MSLVDIVIAGVISDGNSFVGIMFIESVVKVRSWVGRSASG